MTLELPRLIEPETLEAHLDDANLRVIDVCNDSLYPHLHIPRAVHVSPSELVAGTPPAPGKLPDESRLQALFSRLGLTPETHIVVYDDEGGGWAGRFIWTLDVIGHPHWSYLNGGLAAWKNEGHATESGSVEPRTNKIEIRINQAPIADKQQILSALNQLTIWDARSRDEFEGKRATAKRNGHIPGAIHCEWTSLTDPSRNLRLRTDAREYLTQLGLTPDKSLVTHCHTHHRSGLTYLVARLLDYPDIRAYPGSWSEWGNSDDTPVETGP